MPTAQAAAAHSDPAETRSEQPVALSGQPAPEPTGTTPPTRRSTLHLLGLASITVSFLAASSAPTPLYAVYQAAWGFSDLTTTVVFGIYAVVLLAMLLTAGRLSDHIGRRPVVVAGIVGQIAAMLVFADAHGVSALVAGRVVQGLATGAALGGIGAAMLDLDQRRGAAANSTAPGLGTGTGSLLAAAAAQWLPAPTHLIYVALIVVLVAQGLWVSTLPETSPKSAGAWRSLRPRLALPPTIRSPFLAAAPVLFAVWALGGFYASLGPAVLGQLAHSGAVVYGGLPLGILAGVGAVITYLLRNVAAPRVMRIGTASLAFGVGVTLVAVYAGSPTAFIVGTAIAGVGFGAGFQSGIRLVVPFAALHERAGVLSVIYIVSYLGLGIPAVIAGLAVVSVSGLATTTYAYGAVVIALAALATVNLIRLDRSTNQPAIADQPTKEGVR